jgi:hypothetical protein
MSMPVTFYPLTSSLYGAGHTSISISLDAVEQLRIKQEALAAKVEVLKAQVAKLVEEEAEQAIKLRPWICLCRGNLYDHRCKLHNQEGCLCVVDSKVEFNIDCKLHMPMRGTAFCHKDGQCYCCGYLLDKCECIGLCTYSDSDAGEYCFMVNPIKK